MISRRTADRLTFALDAGVFGALFGWALAEGWPLIAAVAMLALVLVGAAYAPRAGEP